MRIIYPRRFMIAPAPLVLAFGADMAVALLI